MRASVIGTVASWVVVVVVSQVSPPPALSTLAVAIAVGFTLLSLAHLGALMLRITALWAMMRAGAAPEVRQRWPTRRVFLTSLLGATLAALLPPGTGQRLEGAASVLRSLIGAGRTGTAHAQVVGRRVRVTVVDANNKSCKNIRVELRPNPACVLHARNQGYALVTFCTDTSFGGAPIRHAKTDKEGVVEFGFVAPGNYIVCLCKGCCVLPDCVFQCDGPSANLAVPAFPAAVPPVKLTLPRCECPDKKCKDEKKKDK